jgi:hypothetical protein
MNSSINYIPNSDSERVTWMNNFNNKLPSYATPLGLTAAEISGVADDTAMFAYVVNLSNIYKQTSRNMIAFKNQLKHKQDDAGQLGAIPGLPTIVAPPTAVAEGVFDRISRLVARIKNSENYTESMGRDLDIIAPVPVMNTAAMQPSLKVSLDAGRPLVKWVKGASDALDLFVNRNDGAGFVLLGRFITPEYIDTVTLNSTASMMQWDYRGMYVMGNNQIGISSAVVGVVVKKAA